MLFRSKLNEERAPIAAENRKVEAEVGPIKYVAALIYGDNPDSNLLERAVRWVIILLVIVFDPLAIALVLAANSSKEWDKLEEDDKAAMSISPEPQKEIAKLNEERAPIAAENRKVEAEVGPIKYVAALIYGDNPDSNLLERAVRWVIILLVIVFDPLAIALVLAADRKSTRLNSSHT